METEVLLSIAKSIKTPAYVFDKKSFFEKALNTKKIVGDEIAICYSIKANPFLIDKYYQPTDLFEKFEVCSIGELRICISSGIPAEMFLYSGVNKNINELNEAYTYGVRLFTIESFNHLSYINQMGSRYEEPLPVLIRISADTQFGMDEKDVISIIKDRDQYQYIDIIGIHYFTGTQKKGYSSIIQELKYLRAFCENVNELYNFKIRNIEYGLGLGVEYFEGQKQGANTIDEVVQELRDLSAVTKLTIEMGRYFAGNCGYYFTKVVDCKVNNGTSYAIVDGGMNQLHYDGQVKSMKVPLHKHLKMTPGKLSTQTKKWTICGSICSTEDIICRDVEYQDLKEEDMLVFLNCGAYSFMEAMSTFLSREMPQIWACNSGRDLELMREFICTDTMNCRR